MGLQAIEDAGISARKEKESVGAFECNLGFFEDHMYNAMKIAIIGNQP